jgi:hypothetical protein
MKSPKRKEKLEKKSDKLLDRANKFTDEGKTVRAGIAAGRADRLTTKMYKKKGGTTTTKRGYMKLGGETDQSCVVQGPGKPKKCKAGKRKRNFDPKRTAGNVLKGVGAAAGTVGLGLAAKFVRDNKKKGGVVKKKK